MPPPNEYLTHRQLKRGERLTRDYYRIKDSEVALRGIPGRFGEPGTIVDFEMWEDAARRWKKRAKRFLFQLDDRIGRAAVEDLRRSELISALGVLGLDRSGSTAVVVEWLVGIPSHDWRSLARHEHRQRLNLVLQRLYAGIDMTGASNAAISGVAAQPILLDSGICFEPSCFCWPAGSAPERQPEP